MNTQPNGRAEREEIEMLLPWYVTGRLDEADAARVAAYLERHPEMAEREKLSRAERNETAHLNALAEDHPPADVDRFMARIAATRHGEAPSETGAMAWLRGLMDAPFGGGLRWAGRGGGDRHSGSGGDACNPAGSPRHQRLRNGRHRAGNALDGSFVLVRFADDASVDAIAQMLSELNMTISDGPKAGGLFTVRIGPCRSWRRRPQDPNSGTLRAQGSGGLCDGHQVRRRCIG